MPDPVTPQGRGRYPGFDVLAQARHWDEATRRVVLARLDGEREPRCFDAAERATLEAFCDTVLAQDAEPRVPVLAGVAARLTDGPGVGFSYADLPPAVDLWRRVARGLDESARALGASGFAGAGGDVRTAVCGAFAAGELHGGAWDDLPVVRAWTVVTSAILSVFYAHPWAWNEIGFGGPAYPRGYMRLAPGLREPWEADESA
jgi:hypothetical protein